MDGALPFVSGVVAGWRRTISPRALVSRSHRGDLPSLGIGLASTGNASACGSKAKRGQSELTKKTAIVLREDLFGAL